MKCYGLRTALMLVLVLFTSTSVSHAKAQETPRLAASPYDLVNAVNALRASYGLAPYSISPILMATAQAHADYMAVTGSVSHTGAGGSSVTERLLAAGYPLAGDLSLGGFRSENITSGSEGTSAQEAVDQWTGDAPHLTTMISPNLTEIGAGVAVNEGRVYFVIDCAQPVTGGVPQTAGAPMDDGSALGPVGGVIIPVVVATPSANGDVIHEVKAGQTLWQIAITYETKIDEIKRLNDLFENDIYPGMALLIKRGVAPVTPPETATIDAVFPTTLPAISATVMVSTPTPAVVSEAAPVARGTIMNVALGIIILALVGGGMFAWFGSSKSR